MKSLLSSNTVVRLVSFIFCFIERLIVAHYQRLKTLFYSFSKTWLEIPLSDKKNSYYSYDSMIPQNHGSVKPRHISIPLSNDYKRGEPELNDISVWNPDEAKKSCKSMNLSIAAKTQNELWLKIKELANERDNSKNFTTNIYDHKVKCHGRRNYMSSTYLKLDEYHKKNREFLLNGEFNQYSFTHFSAKSAAYSKNPIMPGSLSATRAKYRLQKRKSQPFRPTELSTIFENLAY